MVWKELDTKTALKRLKVLVVSFLVPFLIPITFVLYQNLLGYSFSFFTGYALLEYTSLGIKKGGELVVPIFTGVTVFMVTLFFISLPFLAIGCWAALSIRPFENVKGFEKLGKVLEKTRFLIVQGSRKGKLHVAAFTLTWILMLLFLSLWFISSLGILVLNTGSLSFLGLLWTINLLGALYFGRRVEQSLKNMRKQPKHSKDLVG